MRLILHSDLNSFYASVEMMLDPALKERAVAVCGSTETRHGIVLTKSLKAKKAGVATGMTVWEARARCPELVIVPPHYEQYIKYSRMTRAIYERYTGHIEPFGPDECWLDLSGKDMDWEKGRAAADEIRKCTREELGLTVSIGVSFNKVFAKLGSDMKKPDATTLIRREDMERLVWPLPAEDLLWVGPATKRKLNLRNIHTIGDIAKTDRELMHAWLGVNGEKIWNYANGLDTSRVAPIGYLPEVKSAGHGITCTGNCNNEEEVRAVLLSLSPRVSSRLRALHFLAAGVELYVRRDDLLGEMYRGKLPFPTQSFRVLTGEAMKLFNARYSWQRPVRALCIRAVDLISEKRPVQEDFFSDPNARERAESLERSIEDLRRRYGENAVFMARTMGSKIYNDEAREEIGMPGIMYT